MPGCVPSAPLEELEAELHNGCSCWLILCGEDVWLGLHQFWVARFRVAIGGCSFSSIG